MAGIFGAVVGAAGSIYGGYQAAKLAKEQESEIEGQQQKNQDWYDRRYNEDATQRADAQRVLTLTAESIKNRNKAAAGSAAVNGGTTESVAAAKAANNQALSDATSQIAASADARKDNIEATYLQNDAAYTDLLNQVKQQKSNAIAGAVSGLGETVAGIDF